MIVNVKKGFTLAEILVTLGVIGVIASMTVPTLVQDIQDNQYKVAAKKAYADINQATRLLVTNNLGSIKGSFNNTIDIKNMFKLYLNYTKDCNNTVESNGNCWHKPNEYKYLNGAPCSISSSSSLVLNNGSLVYFGDSNTNCTSTTRCGTIVIDVNGFRGPNTWGKDIIGNDIFESNIKIWGSQGAQISCDSSHWGCPVQYIY